MTAKQELFQKVRKDMAANPGKTAKAACEEAGLNVGYYYAHDRKGRMAKAQGKVKAAAARLAKPSTVPVNLERAHTYTVPESNSLLQSGKTTLIVVQTSEPLAVLRQLFA